MCKVTIGIAAYNVENYIGETLNSALNQDFKDLEILVCDDCSTDNTMHVVKDLITSHPNGYKVRIIKNSTNSGTSAVRNNCIDNAKGEFIYFLDGDDNISNNCISLLYSKMKERPVDIVMANHIAFVDSNNVNVTVNKDVAFPDYSSCGEMAILKWMKEVNTDNFPGSMWNKLFNLQFLRENNIRCDLNHWVIDDIYFSFLTILKANSFTSIKDVTLFWRQRPGSAMNREFSEERFNLYLRIFDDMCEQVRRMKIKKPQIIIPKELYYFIGKRYMTGFIMRNLLHNKIVRRKYKEEYFNHIYTIIDIGYKREYAKSILDKIVFDYLNHKYRYLIFKISFSSISFIRKMKSLSFVLI